MGRNPYTPLGGESMFYSSTRRITFSPRMTTTTTPSTSITQTLGRNTNYEDKSEKPVLRFGGTGPLFKSI